MNLLLIANTHFRRKGRTLADYAMGSSDVSSGLADISGLASNGSSGSTAGDNKNEPNELFSIISKLTSDEINEIIQNNGTSNPWFPIIELMIQIHEISHHQILSLVSNPIELFLSFTGGGDVDDGSGGIDGRESDVRSGGISKTFTNSISNWTSSGGNLNINDGNGVTVKLNSFDSNTISATPTHNHSVYNPYLSIARYRLIQFTSNTNNTPTSQNAQQPTAKELDDMALFCCSALEGLATTLQSNSSKISEKCRNATICQISFEVGYYYWICEKFDMAFTLLSATKLLMKTHDIDPESKWISFSLPLLNNAISVCELMSSNTTVEAQNIPMRDISMDPTSEVTSKLQNIAILDYLTSKQYGNPEFLEIMIQDSSLRQIPLPLKRLLLQDIKRTAHISTPTHQYPVTKLHISQMSFTNALTLTLDLICPLATVEKDAPETETLNQTSLIRRELGNVDVEVMINLLGLAEKVVPKEVSNKWKQIWQSILYLSISASPDKSIKEPKFLASFFERYPNLRTTPTVAISIDRGRGRTGLGLDAFLRELMITKIYPGETKYIPALAELAVKYPPSAAIYLQTLAESSYLTSSTSNTFQLINIGTSMNPSEKCRVALDRLLQCTVIKGLVQTLEEFVDTDKINVFIDAFCNDVAMESLRRPPTLAIFGEVLATMIMKGGKEGAFNWTTAVHRTLGDDDHLAHSTLNLGRILLLICSVEEVLVKYGVVGKDTGGCDLKALDAYPLDQISSCSNFGKMVVIWMASETNDEAAAVMYDQIVLFLTDRMPWMAHFVIGTIGGFCSRFLETPLSRQALGPFSIFTIPFLDAVEEGLGNLTGGIHYEQENITFELRPCLMFLKRFCEKSGGMYLLKADVYFALGMNREAVRNYLNFLVSDSSYFHDVEKFEKLLVTHLDRLLIGFERCGDSVSVAVLLQYAKVVPYDRLFSILQSSIGLIAPIELPIYDPPWQIGVSALYAFWDLHVVEFLVQGLRRRGDREGIKFLVGRVRNETGEDLKIRLLVWYLQKIAVKYV